MMETTVINGMCRCCATEGAFKDIKRSYHWMGEEEVYGEMLKECFDIDLSSTEDSEGSICEVCITQLRNASNFKKQVLQTEEQFKKQLQMKFFKPTVVKVEMQDENNQSDDNISIDDGFSGPELEMPIKKEGTEESKPKKRTAAAKASTSRAKKSKANDETADTSTTKRTTRRTKIIEITKPAEPTVELKHINGKTRTKKPRTGPNNGVTEAIKNRINLKNVLLYSNATPIKFKDSLGYRCSFCPMQFPEAMDLKQHTLNQHNDDDLIREIAEKFNEQVMKVDITLLSCSLCDTAFDDLNKFINHLTSKHDKVMYTNVKNWILPFQFYDEELRCSICGATYTTFKLLHEHMNKHYPNYFCDICGVGYITDAGRKRHMKRHDGGEYTCNQCKKVFTSAQKRARHVRNTHLGLNKRNLCNFCDERFCDYWQKIDHMVKEHNLPPVVLNCQACDRTFSNRRQLNKHTRKDHLHERNHKCPECEMTFFVKNTLDKHMTKHTGARHYQCDVCSKWYGRKQTLREHLRIHANDRRFTCAHCGLAFIQKCTWKNHVKSKHGEIVN